MSASSEIQALFNRIAPVYDSMNDWLSLGQHRIWKEMAVKWSRAKAGDTCLDLCCGSGDLAQILSRHAGATGQVFGVDFAAAQLTIAHQRAQAYHSRSFALSPINWVEADALTLPFPDDFFDCATLGYGLRNVVDIPRSLQELHRVLKPGSYAAILDLNPAPSAPVRWFQQWYLDTIVVPIAQHYGFAADYAYLAPSLAKFPTGPAQVKLARAAGFTTATHYPIAGGTMGVLVVNTSL